jgi:hypothetical protein
MARSSTTFKKGEAKGRPTGTPNKATQDIKEAYRMLIEANTPNLIKWLERIAETDPAKAIYILSDLSEYVIPKLARTEVKHEGNIEIKQVMKINGKEIEF